MKATIAAMIMMATTIGYVGYVDTTTTPECLRFGTVTKIMSLNGRSAEVLLDGVEVVSVNQAVLKPGDHYCVGGWKRVRVK